MEKGDGWASRAAGETRVSSHRQKHAMRPGQSKRKPAGRERERTKRQAQPDQLMIDFCRGPIMKR